MRAVVEIDDRPGRWASMARVFEVPLKVRAPDSAMPRTRWARMPSTKPQRASAKSGRLNPWF